MFINSENGKKLVHSLLAVLKEMNVEVETARIRSFKTRAGVEESDLYFKLKDGRAYKIAEDRLFEKINLFYYYTNKEGKKEDESLIDDKDSAEEVIKEMAAQGQKCLQSFNEVLDSFEDLPTLSSKELDDNIFTEDLFSSKKDEEETSDPTVGKMRYIRAAKYKNSRNENRFIDVSKNDSIIREGGKTGFQVKTPSGEWRDCRVVEALSVRYPGAKNWVIIEKPSNTIPFLGFKSKDTFKTKQQKDDSQQLSI